MAQNVSLKYEIFSFHEEIIKSVSLQNQGDVMVFSSGQDNDSLKLVRSRISPDYQDQNVTNKVDFRALNMKSVQSAQLLKWSPNDQFLASAFVKLVIWGYASGDLMKLADFQDHELEIAAVSWAPDSTRIATGSLDGKIVVRSMDFPNNTQKLKEMKHDNKILGLVWDTYDKYLAALYSDNNVIIWKCNAWEKSYIVSLTCPISADHSKISSKRDDRKIDWSPDYRYVLVPSLDDKIVPFVCALDRQKDFKVCKTFMGPFSSINCIKFNSNLFAHKECVINIFALGDNDGNISIWGIGDGFAPKKPFFLFKSHPNGNELIEDICWNAEGNMLIATTLKKYVFVALFGEGVFGEKLSPQQKQDFLEGKYGTLRTVATQNTKFKVFKAATATAANDGGDIQAENILKSAKNASLLSQRTEPLTAGTNVTNFFSIPKDLDKNLEIQTKISYTEQKTIINEAGKKRIIPSKQIVQKLVVEKKSDSDKSDNLLPGQQATTTAAAATTNNKEQSSSTSQPQPSSAPVLPAQPISSATMEVEEPLKQNDAPAGVVSSVPTTTNENKKDMEVEGKPEQKHDMKDESKPNGIATQPNEPANNSQEGQTKSTKKVDSSQQQQQVANQKHTEETSSQDSSRVVVNSAPAKPQQPEQVKLSVPQCLPHIHTMRLISNQSISVGGSSDMRFLEIETPQNQLNVPLITQIRCTVLKSQQIKEILWTDCLEGRLLFVEMVGNQILYYTSSHLLYFVNSTNGRRSDLPLLIPNLCWLKMNKHGQMLSLSEDGELKVYDSIQRKLLIKENIQFLLQENVKVLANNADLSEQFNIDPIENVTLDNKGVPVIFFKTRIAYLFNTGMKTWQKIDNFHLDIGSLNDSSTAGQSSDSVAGYVREAEDLGQFFERLIEVSPGELELENRKDMNIVSKYEERLVYLMKYDEVKNQENFIDTASKYIKKLCDLREFNKIRQFVTDFFCNFNSMEYIFMNANSYDRSRLYRNIKRILDYFPFTADLANEIEEIVSFNQSQLPQPSQSNTLQTTITTTTQVANSMTTNTTSIPPLLPEMN